MVAFRSVASARRKLFFEEQGGEVPVAEPWDECCFPPLPATWWIIPRIISVGYFTYEKNPEKWDNYFVNPLITVFFPHLPSGMIHQVMWSRIVAEAPEGVGLHRERWALGHTEGGKVRHSFLVRGTTSTAQKWGDTNSSFFSMFNSLGPRLVPRFLPWSELSPGFSSSSGYFLVCLNCRDHVGWSLSWLAPSPTFAQLAPPRHSASTCVLQGICQKPESTLAHGSKDTVWWAPGSTVIEFEDVITLNNTYWCLVGNFSGMIHNNY